MKTYNINGKKLEFDESLTYPILHPILGGGDFRAELFLEHLENGVDNELLESLAITEVVAVGITVELIKKIKDCLGIKNENP